jgi:aminobenzoyl-glutamate transport protein
VTEEGRDPGPATSQDERENAGGSRLLDGIERLGNKVPHPAIIFLYLCGFVIVLSAVLSAFDVSVTYDVAEPPPISVEETEVGGSVVPEAQIPPDAYLDDEVAIHQETTEVESLLDLDGIRFLFTSFVTNFSSFTVVAVILIAMLGVGVAEEAGLMAALIRKLVKVAPARTLTFIIVFIGGLSSVASDAGYLILIPLGAAAFLSVGRHPLAGLAAAYAGVSAGFAVNVLITPQDGLLTEITNEAIALVDPGRTIDITANLWFSAVSTIFVALVITAVSARVVEPRLGSFVRDPQIPPGHDVAHYEVDPPAEEVLDEVAESRGLRLATWALLVYLVVIGLLTGLPDGPLRNPEDGSIIGDSPFMDSLLLIITLAFLVMGVAYGIGAKTISSSVDVINAITKTFAALSGLIFLLLIISQFIAYFNYSNMPTVAAVEMADLLERADIGAIWLLLGFILVIALLDIIIPGVLPKWAIFAPVFVPLFLRLDVAPQTVLAAYRVGDSPMNVITPLMVYLPFIVIVAQRYKKDAGIGTILSLMIPYSFIVLIAWLLFFAAWFALSIPMGPGFPAHL